MAKTTPNYYELLGVHLESTEKEIIRAYKKKALSCHPDKNPDNPKAAELFIEISEALKVLTDDKAKAAFDKILKAKEAARLRTQAFDSKRKKFKDDLERREQDALLQNENDVTDAERFAAEIKRLREEGSRLLKEQQELIEKQLAEERKNKIVIDNTPKLKVKWKSSKQDHQNGGYNEDVLMILFQKYGRVTAIVVSKKNGLAIIEYESTLHANMALEFEKGLEENPFTIISWLENEQIKKTSKESKEKEKEPSVKTTQQKCNISTDIDFESMVLLKMAQAEERKRLAQQIIKDDTETDAEKT